MNFSSINWGDVPTWLAAIGAFLAAFIYYKLLRGEIKKREDETRERETFSQRRISAWIDGDKLLIQNKGYEPVYYLVVSYGPFRTDANDYKLFRYVELVIGTMGPDQRLEEEIIKEGLGTGIFPDIPEVSLEFTDCQGKHWVREANGLLHEVEYRRPFD